MRLQCGIEIGAMRPTTMTTDELWWDLLQRGAFRDQDSLPGLGIPRFTTFVNPPDMSRLLEFMAKVFGKYRIPRYWGGQG